jgi:hypothetical protein
MTIGYRSWILILLATICLPLAGVAQPQDQGGQTAQPAAAGAAQGQDQGNQAAQPAPSETPAQAPEEGQALTAAPEGGSLVGVEEFSPGQVGGMHNYFLPSLQVSEMGDSNFRVTSGPQRFESLTSVTGRISLQRVGKHSRIVADYFGGGLIYTHHSELNTTMHQFGITQSITGRRWSFLLDDRATYLPESPFGFGGFGWSGSLGSSLGGALGTNLTSLNPNFNPTSSLLTGRGSRILNTVSTQVSYRTGPRSSLSLAGSYGILHFRSPGFSNTQNAFFQAAFSHTLTPKDQVGISYGFGLFKYPTGVSAFQTHYAQFTYGRRITGRIAASFAAGTQIGVFKTAASGSTTPVSWTAHSSLDYRARRANLAFSYSRYTSNGGGVLAGATTDYLYLAVSRGLGRNWSGSLTPGLSRNRSLPQTTSPSAARTYDSASLNASLSRRLGPYMTMFFRYNFQTQRSTAGSCTTGNCGSTFLRHLVDVGFDWHPREIMVN